MHALITRRMAFNSDFVIVNDVKRDYSRKFRVDTVQYSLKFHPNGLLFFKDFESWYRHCFDNVLLLVKESAMPHYKVGIRIDLPSVENTLPVYVPFMRCDQLSADMIMNVIENVIQSNQAFEDSEKFIVQATILKIINAGARGIYSLYCCDHTP